MRSTAVISLTLALVPVATCLAQDRGWEVGGAVGFGVMRDATINGPSGSATAGFDNRFTVGAFATEDLYSHLSGEIRYDFRDDDLVLKNGGIKVNMDGASHLVHYDILIHPTSKESRIRPFAALGGGIRLFRATGVEYVNQPFSDFAVLTHADEVKPLISVGGGVRARITDHTSVRLDFREYISPFPEQLFVTAPGAKIQGWLFDSVPMAGVSFTF